MEQMCSFSSFEVAVFEAYLGKPHINMYFQDPLWYV